MNFEVKTEVGFNIDDFVRQMLHRFVDSVYDLDYEDNYVLLSDEQKKELKIAVFEKVIETLKKER